MNIEQLININADLIAKVAALEIANKEILEASDMVVRNCLRAATRLTEIEDLKIKNEQLEIRVNQLKAEKQSLETIVRNLQSKVTIDTSKGASLSTDIRPTFADTTAQSAHSGYWDQAVVDKAKATRANISGGTDLSATCSIAQNLVTCGTTTAIVPNTVTTSTIAATPINATFTWDGSSHRGTTYTITGLADVGSAENAATKHYQVGGKSQGRGGDVMFGESMIDSCSKNESLENLTKIVGINIPVPKSVFFSAIGYKRVRHKSRKVETGVPTSEMRYYEPCITNSWDSKWDNMAHSGVSKY